MINGGKIKQTSAMLMTSFHSPAHGSIVTFFFGDAVEEYTFIGLPAL
jgi:hypothetical protein